MNTILFATLAFATIGAVAGPVVFALRRRAWRMAVLAAIVGVAVPGAVIAFAGYGRPASLDMYDALAWLLLGAPLSAGVTCAVLMLVLSRVAPPRS